MSLHLSISSMHYTSDLRETLLNDQSFRTPGKPEANAPKTTRTHNHNDRGSDKPLLTPPPHLILEQPACSNGSQQDKPLEETGEDEEGDNPEETFPELMRSGLKRGIQCACFNCRQQGHFAHNCPTKQKCTNM